MAGTAKQACTTTAPDPRSRRPDLYATQQETGEHVMQKEDEWGAGAQTRAQGERAAGGPGMAQSQTRPRRLPYDAWAPSHASSHT